MKITPWFALLNVVLLLTACSNQQTYTSLKESQRQQCLQRESDKLVRQCLDELNVSYQDYENQRKQLDSNE